MRINKSAAQLAVLALTLVTPMLSFAGPKAQLGVAMPNLMVERDNQSSETALTIRNAGDAASAACHVRILLSTGVVFELPVFELQAGAAVALQIPAARDGKPFTITVEVDCDHEVAESDEDDNTASLRYLS